jgi:DNA-binding transcriptional LysR family regulator
VQEVRELQTAIGLVAAHAGFTIVPGSVQRFRRDDVAYLPIADNTARSPIMMIHRMGDISAELAQLIAISRDVHGVPRD